MYFRYSTLHFCVLFFIALVAVCTGACTSATSSTTAQAPPPPAALRDPNIRALIDNYDRFFADSMLLTQTPGAAVVIVKDSTIIFQRGYGVKRAGSVDSVDANTVFRIGSLSKGFAGVLTGILVQEGKLRWDDRVVRYVPEFALSSPGQTREISLAHLLSHTTGLPYHAYTNMIEAGYDLRDIAAMFGHLPLHGKAGEIYSYQNAAFSLAGEAIRVATGKTYPQALTEKIFRPAGMTNASADWISIRRNQNKAMPHNFSYAGWIPDTITTRFYNAAPAGGVNASINDMGQWLRVLLGHQPDIVSETTLNEVFRPVVRTYKERRYFRAWPGPKEAYYAHGWRVLVSGSDTIVCHGGAVNGFRGEIAIDRKNGIAICALFNASTDMPGLCIPAFFERYRKVMAPKK